MILLAGCGGDDDTDDVAVPPQQPPATAAAMPSETPGAASESPSPSASALEEGTVIEINLVGGKPDPALTLNQKFAKGDTVTIKVTTDKAYEVHVHGYDYTIDAVPGQTVTKTFVLDKTGSWEVEVEETHKLLFNFVVS